MVRAYRPILKPEDVWCEVTMCVPRLPEVGDKIACSVGGLPGVATVTERQGESGIMARVDGLYLHANSAVSRDLFSSVEMSFHINKDGRASTSLNWQR